VVRDITAEEIVEKHALLDVMLNGAEVLDNIENINFKTSYDIIKMYGDPDHSDK